MSGLDRNFSVSSKSNAARSAFSNGVPAAEVALNQVADSDALFVRRFDREVRDDGTIQRLHQENALSGACRAGRIDSAEVQGQAWGLAAEHSESIVSDLFAAAPRAVGKALEATPEAHGRLGDFLIDRAATLASGQKPSGKSS